MAKSAQIVEAVTYREGDGPEMEIRPGPIEVEVNEIDVTLTWADDETRSATAIPRMDFDRHVKRGAIELLG